MESIILSCLLPLSVVIRVRKQWGAEDLSKKEDVLGYPHASSPLLVSVYSCISSASLGPRLGVLYSVTQVTHLEAACCAGREEILLLCNLDTCKKRATQTLWLWNISWFDYFYICFPLHFLEESYGIFILLSTLTPLQLLCKSGFSSVFHWVWSFWLIFFPLSPSTVMRLYLQYISTCIYMHGSTNKTWLRTYFLLLFTVPFLFVSSGPQIRCNIIISFKWEMW